MLVTPPRSALAAAWLCAAALAAGCTQVDGPIELRFDRSAPSVTDHPFPDDRYVDPDTGVIFGFTDVQLAALPFLIHLPLSAQVGWWSGTQLRLPVTPAPAQPARWVDPESVPAAVGLFRLGPDGVATEVPLADHRVARHTNTITVRAAAPLAPGTTYGLVVRDGALQTRGGRPVLASDDYSTIREEGDPATDQSFAAVADADPTIGGREDTLAYVEVTIADHTGQLALLAAYIDGKAPVDRLGDEELLDVTPLLPIEQAEIAAGGTQLLAAGAGAVGAFYEAVGLAGVPTAGIGRITAGLVSTPSFISADVPAAEALFTNGTFLGRDPALPFHPGNPLSLSAVTPFRTVPWLAFFPELAPDPPPAVVAIHGFGLSRESFFTLASALCSGGHAVIAIDNYQHGARQHDIDVPEGGVTSKVDPTLAALGVAFPDPFINPTFLARSRDKVRQSVADQLALVRLLAAADGTVPAIDLDGDGGGDAYGPVSVVGESLGGIVGTMVAAVSPHVHRVVLNVPGAALPAIVHDSPWLGHDTDLLMLATGGADGIGLMAGTGEPLLPDSEAREVYDIVAETVVAAADAGTFAEHVATGALGGASPRALVQVASEDTVIPRDASRRFVRALAAGLEEPLPLLVDGALNQAWFDLGGLPERDPALGFGPAAVAIFPGDHAFLIDLVDPAVTAAAQTQVVQFLVEP